MKWALGLVIAPLALAGATGWYALSRDSLPHVSKPPPSIATQVRSNVAPPPTPTDPLTLGGVAQHVARELPASWVTAPPAAELQYSRPPAEREGIDPCAAPAPQLPDKSVMPLSQGTLFLPSERAVNAAGEFDLLFHLHGEGPVRRELWLSQQPFVLYTLTANQEQSYSALFAGTGLFTQLQNEISATLTQRLGRAARVRHVALSAWSAGFEGVRSLLYQPEAKTVDAVMLIDGLHAPRGKLATDLDVFVDLAQRAARGEAWFVVTHSSIPTSQFASTTETAHFLIDALGARPESVQRGDGFGLELFESFDRGDFHVRGYAGNDKADHCAQLFLLRSLFPALTRHWAR